jgi:hypothetical protein
MWIAIGLAHFKLNSPHSKQFFILASYQFIFTLLVSNWLALMFTLRIWMAANALTSHIYSPHHEGG